MSNPKRITDLLALLEELWLANPELRFNQLIYTLYSEYSNQNNNIGKVEEKVDETFSNIGFDFFNLEDEFFITYLQKKIQCK